MNSPGASSGVRVIRLDELDRTSTPPRPADGPVVAADAPGVRLSAMQWPEPIGSGREPVPAEPEVLASPVLPRLPAGEVRSWPVRFDGVPRDYARMWALNLLKVVLTAGLYAPWARVQHLRYLMRHTRVAGQRFDYLEPPVRVLARDGVTACLVLGVLGAWAGSRVAGMLALSLGMAAWPLLLFVAASRRIAHLSWGGHMLAFDGLCEEVYRALWMPLASGVVLAWLVVAAGSLGRAPGWGWMVLVGSLWLLSIPLSVWAWFQFRQGHLRLGPLRLRWIVQPEGAYQLAWRVLVWGAWSLLMGLGIGLMCFAGLQLAKVRLTWSSTTVVGAIALAAMALGARPYAQARLQNLVWNKTGNRHLRFRSKLSVRRYVMQQWRHALLLVVTGGLYWPWAVMATHRMRMHALRVRARVDTAVLREHWLAQDQGRAAKIAGSPGARAG
jgi:uncharacterized membrane protein YjgN (DUF898 family)